MANIREDLAADDALRQTTALLQVPFLSRALSFSTLSHRIHYWNCL
jgi:hypothetical protein